MQAQIELLASEARTAQASVEVDDNDMVGATFVLDITAGASASDTVTLNIDGYDEVSGKWYTILDSAALQTNATTAYTVFPSATVTANVSANNFLPQKFRAVVEKNNATAITYSLGVNLFKN